MGEGLAAAEQPVRVQEGAGRGDSGGPGVNGGEGGPGGYWELVQDATLAALGLLRAEAERRAGSAAAGIGPGHPEAVRAWVARYGERGLPVLVAALVEQAGQHLLDGDPAAAAGRLEQAERQALTTRPAIPGGADGFAQALGSADAKVRGVSTIWQVTIAGELRVPWEGPSYRPASDEDSTMDPTNDHPIAAGSPVLVSCTRCGERAGHRVEGTWSGPATLTCSNGHRIPTGTTTPVLRVLRQAIRASVLDRLTALEGGPDTPAVRGDDALDAAAADLASGFWVPTEAERQAARHLAERLVPPAREPEFSESELASLDGVLDDETRAALDRVLANRPDPVPDEDVTVGALVAAVDYLPAGRTGQLLGAWLFGHRTALVPGAGPAATDAARESVARLREVLDAVAA